MRIINKYNSIDDIVSLVLSKAKYQKVVVCLDKNSDVEFIDKICSRIDKNVVLMKYYYNKNNVDSFFNTINNGVRIVIFNISAEHYYKLKSGNIFLLNIFIPQSNFVLPYISGNESVYGDNMLICDTRIKDYCTVICMYELALTQLWQALLQNADVDLSVFKGIDGLFNNDGFYFNLVEQINNLKHCLTSEYMEIEEKQLPHYIYLRLCAVLKMLENFSVGNEQYIDFYKTELSVESIGKAYDLIVKHDIIDLIKLNSTNLIKVCCAILNRLKIIIKKYFNFKNIKLNKLNKLNKIIKNQSKRLNIDNLLYISYITNAI